MSTKEKISKAKEEVLELILKHERIKKNNKLMNYNEENTKKDFILPLFRALGWNVEDSSEVTAEEKISKKRVDYGFRINGIPKFFLEAKALKINLDKQQFVEQAIDYSWHKGCTWAVLTNFDTLQIFNAELKTENPFQTHLKTIKYNEYIDRFEELWLLSNDSFKEELLDKEAEKWGKIAKKLPVGKQILEDLNLWRAKLSKDIVKSTMHRFVTEDELDEAVQRILDRLIFIRTCEDRGIESNVLISILREWEDNSNKKLFKMINNIYREFDDNYDSELFQDHLCEQVGISNETLTEIINGLYGTEDGIIRYDFSAIDADVLGSIYEQYLAHILKKGKKRAKITKKNHLRKEKGIYYTPTYIVEFIVKNTLEELLTNRKKDIEKIRILDPACGSGSFLIKSFDVLSEFYRKKAGAQTELSFARQTNILKNNIYGVDLDIKACEITRLNLLLKTTEKRHRLPTLNQNIKCGNSLIDDKDVANDKAFDWDNEFNKIMNEGGFDIVVGNPPYERTLYLEDEKEHYSENYSSAYGAYDIYVLFIEKAIELLKNKGYLGFIVSNKFLVSDYGKELRKFILSNCRIIKIVDLADAKRVFPDALISTVIIILKKIKDKSNYRIQRFTANKDTTIFQEEEFENIPIKKLVAKNGTFNIRYSKHKDSIYKKINKLKLFGKKFDIRTGIMGFEYWNMEPYIHDGKKSKKDIKIATNSYLDSYKFLWGKKINLYKKKFIEPYANIEDMPINEQTEELFLRKNKIIVRGVAKKLTAALDSEGIGFLVAVHSIVVKGKYKPKFILGLLNSELFNWIHKDRFYLGRIPEGSLKYPVSFLKELPLPPKVKKETQNKIVKLVDNIIILNSQLDKLGDKKTDKRKSIEENIDKIYKEINNRVYKIYGITEKEKKDIKALVK